ncbi:MAG: tripartite tricarboxylate transporter substrate binding protein [Burkholderiales bacterium]|nr:tripartite tricarboxylate transporter substrate binding protein [Burkholderiales bacterium]
MRNCFAAACAAFGLVLAAPTGHAQEYPVKPVKLVIPFPQAGTVDPVTRMLAEALTRALGQQVVVENKPGANGNIGTTEVTRAAPDGYTLVAASSGTLATNPALYKSMPFNPQKDLAPVALYASVPNILVVTNTLPAASLAEFTSHVRANPGKLNFGSSGNGSSMHLAGELYRKMSGTQMTHVPYLQVGNATIDLISGQLQLMFQLVPGVTQQIRAGSIRPLAVLSPKRLASLPNVPTSAEAGMPGLESSAWFGVLAPSGTPRAVIERLNRDINLVLKEPALIKRYADLGVEALGGTPEDFARYLESETVKWAEVVRFSGAKID